MEENNKVEVLGIDSNPTISINNDTFFAVSLYKDKFLEEKELSKFIKNVERLVRASPEYNNLITYMRQELNLNSCAYLNNINTEKVAVEFHHTIFSLYDIVAIIINMFETENRSFNSLVIATEVINLHYSNLCGLIPLSKTIHQLVHSDEAFMIHKELVIGNVDVFVDKFRKYIPEELLGKYLFWCKYAEENPKDKYLELELFDQENRNIHVDRIAGINKLSKKESLENNKTVTELLEGQN